MRGNRVQGNFCLGDQLLSIMTLRASAVGLQVVLNCPICMIIGDVACQAHLAETPAACLSCDDGKLPILKLACAVT